MGSEWASERKTAFSCSRGGMEVCVEDNNFQKGAA